MLSTLARTSRYLEPSLERTAIALAAALVDAETDGRMPRIVGSRHRGVLEDEAFVAAGMLDLFEATGDRRWFEQAVARTRSIEQHFRAEDGGWHGSGSDDGQALARPYASRDGAEPSGASVHVRTLLRLAAITGSDAYRQRADQALRAYAVPLAEGHLDAMLPAVSWRHARTLEIVIVAPAGKPHDRSLLNAIDRRIPWRHVRLLAHEDQPDAVIGTVATGKLAHDGTPTIYVCEAGMCQAPVTGLEGLERVLDLVAPRHRGKAEPASD